MKIDPSKMDPYEWQSYERLSGTPEHRARVLINSVEGDWSQLSPYLRGVAKKMGAKVVRPEDVAKEGAYVKPKARRGTAMQRYMEEPIMFGGPEPIPRGEAIRQMRAQGATQAQIDAWLMGYERTHPPKFRVGGKVPKEIDASVEKVYWKAVGYYEDEGKRGRSAERAAFTDIWGDAEPIAKELGTTPETIRKALVKGSGFDPPKSVKARVDRLDPASPQYGSTGLLGYGCPTHKLEGSEFWTSPTGRRYCPYCEGVLTSRVRPRIGRRIRGRGRGPGKGWHRQPKRHGRAARKGWSRRRRSRRR